WQDVAWRDGPRDDFVAPDLEGLHGLVDSPLEIFTFRLAELRLLSTNFIHVPDRRFASDPAFAETASCELPPGATDTITRAKQSFHRHHPVVSPLIFRRRVVFRPARPSA